MPGSTCISNADSTNFDTTDPANLQVTVTQLHPDVAGDWLVYYIVYNYYPASANEANPSLLKIEHKLAFNVSINDICLASGVFTLISTYYSF